MKSNLAIDRKSQLQGELFAPLSVVPAPSASKKARSGAFGDNMKMPVHRWFRYSAGFSAEWAKKVISDTGISDCEVLDPFAGSGTTLIAAQEVGAFGVSFEAHPFVARIAAAKMGCQGDPDEFMDAVDLLLDAAARQSPIAGITVPPLLTKCYTP